LTTKFGFGRAKISIEILIVCGKTIYKFLSVAFGRLLFDVKGGHMGGVSDTRTRMKVKKRE
jgi:hypothetical protein